MCDSLTNGCNSSSLKRLSSDFDFKAVHNGESCIESLKPEDKGTEHQFWFTRQMLREIFDAKPVNTITAHVEALVNRGVLNDVKNLTSLNVENEKGNGAVKSILYNE